MFDQLCELQDGLPVEIVFLRCWVNRKRHYWLAGPTGGLDGLAISASAQRAVRRFDIN